MHYIIPKRLFSEAIRLAQELCTSEFLCVWFRASLIYINNCPTRCNTKQSIYYSASSLYMFRVSTTPIIRSTQNCNYSLRYCAATSLQRGQVWLRWREVAAQKIWPVPEAVVTILCAPDDGCGWNSKHVEWTCRIIYRLLCVASRWTIICVLVVLHCVSFHKYNLQVDILLCYFNSEPSRYFSCQNLIFLYGGHGCYGYGYGYRSRSLTACSYHETTLTWTL